MSGITDFDTRQPNKFRFSLIENFVKVSVLPNAPQGWETNLLNWSRSEVYYGMVRGFTMPMNFVLDGAWILRTQFYTHGIGAQVQLLIERFNSATYNYEQLFLGDIDFTNFKDTGSSNGYVVTCNVVQSGITKFVKAFEDVKYTIPLKDLPAIDVQLTPILLKETADFIFAPYSDTVEDGFPGLNLVTNDSKSTTISAQSVENTPTPPPVFSTDGHWFYQANVANSILIQGINITGNFGNAGQPGIPTIDISIYKQDGSKVYTVFTATSTDDNFTINFTAQIPVIPGDRLYLFVVFPGSHGKMNIVDGELFLSYNVISPATKCRAYRPFDLFANLMKQMNNNVPVPCRSSLLQQWNTLAITCGDSIRPVEIVSVNPGDTLTAGQEYTVVFGSVLYGLITYPTNSTFTANSSVPTFSTSDDGYCQTSNNQPAIITSFKDFFNAMNAVLNVGWGTEVINGVETSVLESKSYFFKSALKAITLSSVNSFTLSVFQNYLYNSVRYGYEDQTYDNINGNNEFNSTAIAAFPVTVIKKQYEIISPYRADSTGIELLRINLSNSGAGTSNTSGNNDVFMIHINANPDPGQTYYSPYVYPSFSGVDTNLYNMEISPKRNLLRHGDFIHGVLDKLDGENITFTSALKNFNLITTDAAGKVVVESANIFIASLPPKLFLPYQAEIIIGEPFDMLDLLDKYPTGYIQYPIDDNMYGGFIIDCNTDISLDKPQKIKLLYTSNNNMQNLIT